MGSKGTLHLRRRTWHWCGNADLPSPTAASHNHRVPLLPAEDRNSLRVLGPLTGIRQWGLPCLPTWHRHHDLGSAGELKEAAGPISQVTGGRTGDEVQLDAQKTHSCSSAFSWKVKRACQVQNYEPEKENDQQNPPQEETAHFLFSKSNMSGQLPSEGITDEQVQVERKGS